MYMLINSTFKLGTELPGKHANRIVSSACMA